MQQSNEVPAEPSMEDILASIRKIISEEPAGSKQNANARPGVATQLTNSQPAVPKHPMTSMSQPVAAGTSRLSDIVRELAPAAVPVSSISTASFHDDMSDLVEGGPSDAAPVIKLADATSRLSPAAPGAFRPSMPAEPAGNDQPAPPPEPIARSPVMKSTPNIPAPILAPQTVSKAAVSAAKPSSDFGSFIPSTAESIGMTSPRPMPLSLGSEFRNVQPPRSPAPARVARPEPQPVDQTAVQDDLVVAGPVLNRADDGASSVQVGDNDPVAAAQSALGALAMGFAAPAQPATSVSTVAPVHAEVALQQSEKSSGIETGRKSLDDSIIDMLRPMLRGWLDTHLPEMVEKALSQELRDQRERER